MKPGLPAHVRPHDECSLHLPHAFSIRNRRVDLPLMDWFQDSCDEWVLNARVWGFGGGDDGRKRSTNSLPLMDSGTHVIDFECWVWGFGGAGAGGKRSTTPSGHWWIGFKWVIVNDIVWFRVGGSCMNLVGLGRGGDEIDYRNRLMQQLQNQVNIKKQALNSIPHVTEWCEKAGVNMIDLHYYNP